MSRSVSPIPTNVPVSSGTQVVTPMYTDTAVTAGDYIYMYGTGTMGTKSATVGLGVNTTWIAGTAQYGYTQTGVNFRSVSYSPLYDQGLYTDATRTVANTYQSDTAISSTTGVNLWDSCVLNNGNIAMVYCVSGTINFYISIYTPAGVQVKAQTTIVNSTGTNAYISAMADGGFVVAYYNTSSITVCIQRFDSLGNTLLGNTTLSVNWSMYSIAALKNGSYVVAGGTGGAQLLFIIISSNNVIGSTQTVTSATLTDNVNAVGLTNGNFVLSYNRSGTTANYAIFTSSGSAVLAQTNSGVGANTSIAPRVCALETGFAMSLMPNGAFSGIRTFNNSGTARGTLAYTGTSYPYSGICAGQNNTVYVILKLSGTTTPFLLYIANTTDTVPTFVSLTTVSPSFTNIVVAYTNFTLPNCLNGSVFVPYRNTSTTLLSFQTINIDTYTQNVTTLTGANYTPATNYYFLGVAASSAAAGGTINVITNGNATLPSTYPSVTSSIAFDYQNGASSSAQRGTIIGRTIALKGLE